MTSKRIDLSQRLPPEPRWRAGINLWLRSPVAHTFLNTSIRTLSCQTYVYFDHSVY